MVGDLTVTPWLLISANLAALYPNELREPAKIELNIQLDQCEGGGLEGRVKQKRLPSPMRPELSTQICPPIASTNCLQI
jgi:hypothetical protein